MKQIKIKADNGVVEYTGGQFGLSDNLVDFGIAFDVFNYKGFLPKIIRDMTDISLSLISITEKHEARKY